MVRPSSTCVPDGGDPATGDAPILHDPAVHQPNLTFAPFGYCGIMGDQQQGRPVPGVLLEQAIDDELTGIAVEIPGGLVSEQQLWSGDEGAGDRHALLLAARQLARVMRQAMTEADRREGFCRGGKCIGATAELEWDRDILQGRHRGQQVEGLKDDADPSAAEPGERILVEAAEIDPVDPHSSRTRPLQPAEHHHQCGFP